MKCIFIIVWLFYSCLVDTLPCRTQILPEPSKGRITVCSFVKLRDNHQKHHPSGPLEYIQKSIDDIPKVIKMAENTASKVEEILHTVSKDTETLFSVNIPRLIQRFKMVADFEVSYNNVPNKTSMM